MVDGARIFEDRKEQVNKGIIWDIKKNVIPVIELLLSWTALTISKGDCFC